MSTTPSTGNENEFVGATVDGRYELVEEIGRGAMGVVYRAKQLRVNRDVAVKLVRSELLQNEKTSARFEREAVAVAKLEHPNCLTLHDFGFDEELGALFMVTEFLRGQTLAESSEVLTDLSRLQIGYYIADALKHAHEAGVIHRDLKPENVMLHFDDDGKLRLKVVDFGLALLFERHDDDDDDDELEDIGRPRRLTQLGEICGSPRYLSPEQCLGDLNLTSAADMYAFGVLLYELFDGDVPFTGPSVPEILLAHMHDEPPSMMSFPVVDVEQLIYDLLTKNPEERPTAVEAREIFGRHVDLTRSGVFDESFSLGLAESTFGSDPHDDEDEHHEADATNEELPPAPSLGDPSPPAAGSQNTLELLASSPEARAGAIVGVVLTVILLLAAATFWLITR